MRYAIYSNIYGHYERYVKVIDYLNNQNIHRHISLGDIVGYGSEQNQCVEMLASQDVIAIKGDWDEICSENKSCSEYPLRLNENSIERIDFTRQLLIPKWKTWISDLPSLHYENEFSLVHKAAISPEMWNGKVEGSDVKLISKKISFIGHFRSPMFFYKNTENPKSTPILQKHFCLDKNAQYLVSVGSIFKLLDNQPSEVILYDSVEQRIELHQIPYINEDGTFLSGRTAPLLPKSPIQDQDKHEWPKE